jgi:hypothetical protein
MREAQQTAKRGSGCPEKLVSGQVICLEGGAYDIFQFFSYKFLSTPFYLMMFEI